MSKEEVLKRLREVSTRTTDLSKPDMTLSENTTNQESVVASYSADLPLAVREGKPITLALAAFDTWTTNSTSGDSETFSFAHNIIESPTTSNFVLYEGGSLVQPDSVDYANNSFTYTDDGTGNNLYGFYIADNPGTLTIRKVSPGGIPEDIHTVNLAIAHARDQHRQPLTADFRHELQPVVPRNWDLEIVVDVDYQIDFEADGAPEATAANAIIDIPIREARQNIDGLGRIVREAAATNGN